VPPVMVVRVVQRLLLLVRSQFQPLVVLGVVGALVRAIPLLVMVVLEEVLRAAPFPLLGKAAVEVRSYPEEARGTVWVVCVPIQELRVTVVAAKALNPAAQTVLAAQVGQDL
jgi:hypothetical protein